MTDYRALAERLHKQALPDPQDEREVMHAPLLYEAAAALTEAADTIERLGKDSARLDHVDSKRATVYCSLGSSRILHWVFVDETSNSRKGVLGKTLRAAIDAAMKGQT